MRILITGGSSLLGGEVLNLLATDEQCKAVVTVHKNSEFAMERCDWLVAPLDVGDRGAVTRLVDETRPDAIVHLSSLGDLDYCDKHPDEAVRINIEGTRNIVDAAKLYGARVLFSSTIYVFDGLNPPYAEDAPTNPVNLYGRTKLEAERIVLEADRRNSVFRLTTMYGWHSAGQRRNWVTWLISKLESGETVPVVTDVRANNVWVTDVAGCFVSDLKRCVGGVFHVGGSETTNRYEFSVAIAEAFRFPPELLEPVTSAHFGNLATRPRNTACKIDRICAELRVFPLGVLEGLKEMRASDSAHNRFRRQAFVG